MGRSKTYENVSSQRLACMKANARSKAANFARQNGYRIEKWNVPGADSGRWHVILKSNDKKKPGLDFVLQVTRRSNNQLTVEAIHLPVFISLRKAIAQVDSIYNSCK